MCNSVANVAVLVKSKSLKQLSQLISRHHRKVYFSGEMGDAKLGGDEHEKRRMRNVFNSPYSFDWSISFQILRQLVSKAWKKFRVHKNCLPFRLVS